MASYYVNKLAQENGDHEVHESECSHLPPAGKRRYLGEFSSCHGAVWEARKHYSHANGCYHCSRECHTS